MLSFEVLGRTGFRQSNYSRKWLFSHLLPGDVVLADRGFTLSDDFAVYGAKLVLPSFTRGKTEPTASS